MHVLTDEQKQNRFSMCQDLQNKLQTDTLFLPRSMQWSNSRWHWRWEDLITYHNSQKTVGRTCQVQNTRLLQMYPARAQSLDSVHKVTRKLYQWEHHGWNVNTDIKKKTIQFWNFLITSHICITNIDVNICKVTSLGTLEGRKCLLYASRYCQL